ncbi:MAG: capsular polysaccharide biosynthesis protein [Oscillospiraceae bacterium]|nr:capsular polysaccharide biosynthesis protein [Oscillospiraceae bacterium]
MTDFHSHILPGIDDGSDSPETSIAMLRKEAEQGIRQVIATPHFYAGYMSPDAFLKKRDRAEALLRNAMEKSTGLPELQVGAEVSFFRGMSESEALRRLTIREKHCILIEMPPPPWSEELYRELEAIWVRQGLVPIIAHIDRYIGPLRTHGIPQRLMQLPVAVQANAEFFLNRSTAPMALRMLKAGQIHLLGSDCHNLTSRAPNLGPAMQRITQKLGEGILEEIHQTEQEILGV